MDTGKHEQGRMDELNQWEPQAETAELRDALDHIMRVANSSRDQTRRIKWISQRAQSALNNDDKWREIDIPKNGIPKQIELRDRAKEAEDCLKELINEIYEQDTLISSALHYRINQIMAKHNQRKQG